MKSVLMSIQPKWCELIASGKKTVEVRKTRPKLETPFKVYIYCTKDKNFNFCTDNGEQYTHIGNGKVIGEFVCEKITDARDIGGDEFYSKSCLTYEDWRKYTDGTKNTIWLWHISNLVIYDKPRELGEFSNKSSRLTFDNNGKMVMSGITRPPQSWCYVESEVAAQ